MTDHCDDDHVVVDDYKSDSEDALALPSMRRRHASDDEDSHSQEPFQSDDESDGQGAAQVYDDDDGEKSCDDDNGDECCVDDEGEENRGLGFQDEEVVGGGELGEESRDSEEGLVVAVEEEEDKKERERCAVPTAGAFYMHDDRLRSQGRGRASARNLWAPKEEHAWLHDRFEEMNLQDSYHGNGKPSRGRFRGGGTSRSAGRGFVTQTNNSNNDNGNQNRVIRTVRGRGPIHYEARVKSIKENLPTKQKQSPAKHHEPKTNYGVRRLLSPSRNLQSKPVRSPNHSSSYLSHASPPFYPSNSSSQPVASQKQDGRAGNIGKGNTRSVLDGTSQTSHSSSATRGKMLIDTIVNEKRYVDDPIRLVPGKPLMDSHTQSPGLSSSTDFTLFSSSGVRERGSSTVVQPSNHLTTSYNHFPRSSAPAQSLNILQRSLQLLSEHEELVSTQKLVQRFGSGNHWSSPSLPSLSLSEVREFDSHRSSSQSNSSLVGKEKISNQVSARGSILYGDAHVMGANGDIGVSRGDQDFAHASALLPVMQFGRQESGGLGIPTLGMALPGYVARPPLGLDNFEMAWLPMLASGAGSLGASYCPPDSSYALSPGLKSSAASSREASSEKQSYAGKSSEISDIVNDGLGQSRSRPLRYSEMRFGQRKIDDLESHF